MCLLVAGEAGDGGEAPLQVLVRGDDVAHLAIVVLAVGHHVEVAGTGQADDDILGLVVLLALHRLVNGHADGVAAFRRGQDTLAAGEQLRRLEHGGLLHAASFQHTVVVQLADDAAHAMIPQAAGVVGGGDKAVAQGVHLGHGADLAGVAEVVFEHATGQAGAGGRLHGDDLIVCLAAEHLAHEGGDQAAQIGAAAGAADNDVRLDAVFIQRRLRLQTDDGLVQQHLIQHTAQHIAGVGRGSGALHGLTDGAAQRAGGVGELRQDLAAYLGGQGGGGGHVGAMLKGKWL